MAPAFGVEIAIIQDEQVLLTKRTDLPVWCLPGGAVEERESLAQAAIREAHEETGLLVALDRIVGLYSRSNWGEGAHAILFAAHIVSGTLLTTTNETVDAGFFRAESLPPHLLWWYHQRIADAFVNTNTVAWTQEVFWPWGNARRDEMYERFHRGEFVLSDAMDWLCRKPEPGKEKLDIGR